jgi:DNA-binding transcriptional LysR family regulator
MNLEKLRSVDLNLLVVFVVLVRERSASRAAERLSLSQPAISQSLRKLRVLFKDKLFTRDRQGIVPTPLARELYGELVPSLEMLERTITKYAGTHQLVSSALCAYAPVVMRIRR